jgi:hypothetical protein
MAATPHDNTATGTTVTFPGFTGSVTNIVFSQNENASVNADRIDISHLGQTTGETMRMLLRPLKSFTETGKTISIDYIGSGILSGGSTGTLVIAGGLTVNATATVQSSSVTLAVNDVIRGTAEFRVA